MKLEHGQKDTIVEELIEFLSENMDSENSVESLGIQDDSIDTNLYSLFYNDQILCAADSLASKTCGINRIIIALLDNNKLLAISNEDNVEGMYYSIRLYKNGGDFTVETSDYNYKKILKLSDKSRSLLNGIFYTEFGLNIKKIEINKVLKPISLEQIMENSEKLSK